MAGLLEHRRSDHTGRATRTPTRANGLTATAVASDRIALAWRRLDRRKRIQDRALHRRGVHQLHADRADRADVSTFVDTGLTGTTSYTYRVRAYNGGGDSANSNTATATTPAPAPTAPSAPLNLTATAISSSRIDLAWTDASTDESGFKVERCTGTCTDFVEVAQLAANAPSYSDTGRTADTLYRYRVRAYNAAGNSTYAGPVEARTQPAQVLPPAAPSNLVLSVVSSTQIDLSWIDNSTDESSFRIERCTGTGCANFVQIAEVAAAVTGYANTNLQAGTSYTYRVRAHGPGGDSAYAPAATASTQLPPPDVPAAPATWRPPLSPPAGSI